ncbi:MAG TPA: aldehyde dehydrogenase family protein [Candidatus Bathyarchaeia archaeon]|nr:aldehyde dehydrogenase family protein [Candidatus Bathyarchaeia archaeon]
MSTRLKKSAKKSVRKSNHITYASLKITPNDDLAYDQSVKRVQSRFTTHFSMYINGEQWVSSGDQIAHHSPVDNRIILSYFPNGNRGDAKMAIDAARAAFGKWSSLPYKDRVKVLRRAADIILERRFELSAWMAYEVGKNRGESLAEVNEAAELIRYYCDQMILNNGFARKMESPAPHQQTMSILRPYGVWAVIAPWNFPLALSTGMTAGALVTGNVIVFKPSSDSPVLGYELSRALTDAGIPRGVFNFITGPGNTIGAELQENPNVDGLIFTGSKKVGMQLYHEFAKDYPKPVITEMGGKNPTIVTRKADLNQAAEGIMRAAFGFGGQKCSACSRVYVDLVVKERFLDNLKEWVVRNVKIGNPMEKEIFLGPLINRVAIQTYTGAVQEARHDGGRIIHGGRVLTEGVFEYGNYVEPAIIDQLPPSHRLFKDELFVPFLVVAGVNSLDEALALANRSEYGLCAGIYSKDRNEIKQFLDQIQVGVTYVNRNAGATTGAWPGVNSFGGWKASGSTGKNALGPYYVQQFMREQSRWTVNA